MNVCWDIDAVILDILPSGLNPFRALERHPKSLGTMRYLLRSKELQRRSGRSGNTQRQGRYQIDTLVQPLSRLCKRCLGWRGSASTQDAICDGGTNCSPCPGRGLSKNSSTGGWLAPSLLSPPSSTNAAGGCRQTPKQKWRLYVDSNYDRG